MERNYETLSLETHLFFGRIMKEHSFFLTAGFPSKNASYIKTADWYRMQFEDLLQDATALSENRIRKIVLASGEVVTEYTLEAEKQTEYLTGIPINRRITQAEAGLCASQHSAGADNSRRRECAVRELNQRALRLTDGLIEFKEKILKDVDCCRLFTFNYPLLIEHILREAKMYRSLVRELERTGTLRQENMQKMEDFWNRIMMEHALFIRGLLDPSEETLILTADEFAEDYRRLLEEAKEKDCMAWRGRRNEGVYEETVKYRDFKAAGTKGIVECKIAGLILPLLADHVLREANHYLRLLKEGEETSTDCERRRCTDRGERRCN